MTASPLSESGCHFLPQAKQEDAVKEREKRLAQKEQEKLEEKQRAEDKKKAQKEKQKKAVGITSFKFQSKKNLNGQTLPELRNLAHFRSKLYRSTLTTKRMRKTKKTAVNTTASPAAPRRSSMKRVKTNLRVPSTKLRPRRTVRHRTKLRAISTSTATVTIHGRMATPRRSFESRRTPTWIPLFFRTENERSRNEGFERNFDKSGRIGREH